MNDLPYKMRLNDCSTCWQDVFFFLGGGADFSPEEADRYIGAMQIPQQEMFSLADKTTD